MLSNEKKPKVWSISISVWGCRDWAHLAANLFVCHPSPRNCSQFTWKFYVQLLSSRGEHLELNNPVCCYQTLEPNSLHQRDGAGVRNEIGSLIVNQEKGGNIKQGQVQIIEINCAEAYLGPFQERLLSYSSNQQYFKAIKGE